jgi:hypothetical protein
VHYYFLEFAHGGQQVAFVRVGNDGIRVPTSGLAQGFVVLFQGVLDIALGCVKPSQAVIGHGLLPGETVRLCSCCTVGCGCFLRFALLPQEMTTQHIDVDDFRIERFGLGGMLESLLRIAVRPGHGCEARVSLALELGFGLM